MNQALVRKLTDRVWFVPPGSDKGSVQPSVGIVLGDHETTLIDAGNTPRMARAVHTDLRRLKLPPVGRVIYTHHHWDHVFGACVFDVPVIAHALCHELLQDDANRPWSEAYLEVDARLEPRRKHRTAILREGVEDWSCFRVVLPSETFERTFTLDCGDVTLELEHVGGKHAADSIVVRVPGERVMFLGDSFYPPPRYLGLDDETFDLEMLESFLSDGYSTYVDGHNGAVSRPELQAWLQEQR